MDMEGLPNVVDAIRRMSEAYAASLSIMTKALEGMPKPGNDAQRRQAEDWFRMARLGKDGVVAALNQGFELWERECRRAMGALSAQPSSNPMEAWADNWRKMLETFMATSKLGEAWSDEARKQVALVQQTMQEGLQAWQRFWQPAERKP